MLSPIPRRNRKVHISLSSPTMAAFPDFWAGRLPHCVFRGLLSVHSRYGLHTCQVTYMTLYTGGFSRFVASAAAPIATGWSDLAGRDSHPLRNRAFARRTKNRTFRNVAKTYRQPKAKCNTFLQREMLAFSVESGSLQKRVVCAMNPTISQTSRDPRLSRNTPSVHRDIPSRWRPSTPALIGVRSPL